MWGRLGLRTLLAFLAFVVLGVTLFGAGLVADDRTLRGVGVLSTFVGLVGATFLAIRWLIFRGIV
jgi:hypothetical protein